MDGRIVQWMESKYRGLRDELSEFMRRRWAAVEAVSLGRGGISAVSAATGLEHNDRRGIRELKSGSAPPGSRERRPGAGRKRIDVVDPHLRASLERLVNRRVAGTRNRRCGGPARARGGWRRN